MPRMTPAEERVIRAVAQVLNTHPEWRRTGVPVHAVAEQLGEKPAWARQRLRALVRRRFLERPTPGFYLPL